MGTLRISKKAGIPATTGIPASTTADYRGNFGLDERVVRAVASGRVPAPSVAPGVALAAGLVVTEVFNVLTRRRRPVAAPRTLVFDALEGRTRVVRFRSASYASSLMRVVAKSRLGLNHRVTSFWGSVDDRG